MTAINQFKPDFKAKYSGANSLMPGQELKTSFTSTLYLGLHLWKGASIFINPEIAGGSGLSQALGVAAATNGETFRIGSPRLKAYIARLYFNQIFALKSRSKPSVAQFQYLKSDFNQLGQWKPERYINLTVGKVAISDFFDNNQFSHDPRTQFMSWALMSNGAWDYPANTRGYTPSLIIAYVSPKSEIRYGFSLVPKIANGNSMNWNIKAAGSHTIEYTLKYKIKLKAGSFRVLGFYTTANMGNYLQSIALSPLQPNIVNTRSNGRSKYGLGINVEQELNKWLGCFIRASWNDGNNETWAFTEIDHSVSGGIALKGNRWNRNNDNIGLAGVVSGLSGSHRAYLKAGGKGFMLGDGNLNYGVEQLTECYYSTAFLKGSICVTTAYQLLFNPGYNKDRKGPVNVFSIRLHARI